jgi:hypothetical protein
MIREIKIGSGHVEERKGKHTRPFFPLNLDSVFTICSLFWVEPSNVNKAAVGVVVPYFLFHSAKPYWKSLTQKEQGRSLEESGLNGALIERREGLSLVCSLFWTPIVYSINMGTD